MCFVRLNGVMRKEFAHERDISAPGEFQFLAAVGKAELRFKGAREGFHPCSAGADERPVDVK